MFKLQQHLWMLFERGTRNLVGILRRYGQHNSTLAQIESHTLHSKMGLAGSVSLGNLDAVQPVISNNSAPDRVVEVEDQDFAALAPEHTDHAGHVIGVQRDESARKRKLGHVPKLRVVPVRKTDGLSKSGDVQQNIIRMEHQLSKLAVDSVDQIPNRARERAVETAKQGFNGRSDALKDTNRIRVRFDAITKRSQIADGSPNGSG